MCGICYDMVCDLMAGHPVYMPVPVYTHVYTHTHTNMYGNLIYPYIHPARTVRIVGPCVRRIVPPHPCLPISPLIPSSLLSYLLISSWLLSPLLPPLAFLFSHHPPLLLHTLPALLAPLRVCVCIYVCIYPVPW